MCVSAFELYLWCINAIITVGSKVTYKTMFYPGAKPFIERLTKTLFFYFYCWGQFQ